MFGAREVDQRVRVGAAYKRLETDLILDSAAAGQFVAVADGNYDGGLEEKRVSPLQNKTQLIERQMCESLQHREHL